MLRALFQNPAALSSVKLDMLFVKFQHGEDELKLLAELSPANLYNQNSLHYLIHSQDSYLLPTCLAFIGYLAAGKQGDKSAVVDKAYALLTQRMSYICAPDKQKDRLVDLIRNDDKTNLLAYVDLIIVLVTHGLSRKKAEELLMTEHGSLLPLMLDQAKKLYAYDMIAFLDCGFLSKKEMGGFSGFAKRRKAAELEIREYEKSYQATQLVRTPHVDEDGFVLVESGLQQFHLHAQPANSAEFSMCFEREHQPVVINP